MRLEMGRRDIVDKYIEQLEQLYEDHRMLERAQKSAEDIHHHISNYPEDKETLRELFQILNKLDMERVDYMQAAGNYALNPPPNGIYEWSSSLEKSGHTVTYWKLDSQIPKHTLHSLTESLN